MRTWQYPYPEQTLLNSNLGNSTIDYRKLVIKELSTDWVLIFTREVTSNYERSLLGNTYMLSFLKFNKCIHLTNNLIQWSALCSGVTIYSHDQGLHNLTINFLFLRKSCLVTFNWKLVVLLAKSCISAYWWHFNIDEWDMVEWENTVFYC